MDKKEDKKNNINKWIIFGLLIIILISIIYFRTRKDKLTSLSFSDALKKTKIKKIASKYT